MKKNICTAFFLLLGMFFFLFGPSVEASFSYYWDEYISTITKKNDHSDPVLQFFPKKVAKPHKSVRFSSPYRSSINWKPRFTSNTPGIRWTTEPSVNIKEKENPKVTASFNSLLSETAITKITTDPIDIFEISFVNRNPKISTRLHESLYINELSFSLFNVSGIGKNFGDFALSVEDQDFRFDDKGGVTLKFKNLRLSSGERSSIKVAIKVQDPTNIPHTPGSMSVRLDRATARTELKGKVFDIIVSGKRTSPTISFKPTPVSYGSPTFSGESSGIPVYGKMLSSGSSEVVMAVGLRANNDDLFVDEITLHDTIGTNAVDVFIDKIEAIDVSSGTVIGSTSFSNGRARFKFSNRIFVSRKEEKNIAFRVYLEDRIQTNYVQSEFRLNLNQEDISVQSYSSGAYLPNQNKNFSIKNETFRVVDTVLTVNSPTTQKRNLIIGNGLKLVHDVSLSVQGRRKKAELSRISFQISPNNLGFPGGISSDDFELVEIIGNRQRGLPANVLVNGNILRFDLLTPLSVYSQGSVKLGIKMSLENLASINNSDRIIISMLGDTDSLIGSLETLKNSNSNFIWSDISASRHSIFTQDWSTGYLLPGVPSQTVAYKRSW